MLGGCLTCAMNREELSLFAHAMNLLDRFLSVRPAERNNLQVLGAACLLIASKLRESMHLTVADLAYYSAGAFDEDCLRSFETTVLNALDWDVCCITPHAFYPHLMARLPLDCAQWDAKVVKQHTFTIIALCAADYEFALRAPSVIACVSLAAALLGLGWTDRLGRTKDELLALIRTALGITLEDFCQAVVQANTALERWRAHLSRV